MSRPRTILWSLAILSLALPGALEGSRGGLASLLCLAESHTALGRDLEALLPSASSRAGLYRPDRLGRGLFTDPATRLPASFSAEAFFGPLGSLQYLVSTRPQRAKRPWQEVQSKLRPI